MLFLLTADCVQLTTQYYCTTLTGFHPISLSLIPGIFLCLDCSATHRNLGVHTSFVRSVDLDEWTQRQIDAMRLGGNQTARTYFRQHGITDPGKQPSVTYTSRCAQTYKAQLAKLLDEKGSAPAAGASSNGDSVNNLLQNLSVADQQVAKANLAAATKTAEPQVAKPTATLASQMQGTKGKLSVGNSGSGLQTLRKPAGSSTTFKMKKIGGGGASKLRVNKLSVSANDSLPAAVSSADANELNEFEDAQQEEQAVVAPPAPVVEEKPKLVVPPPAPAPVSPAVPATQQTMAESMKKLQSMNTDFFAGM